MMILQALARYYEILADDPKSGIAPYGYSIANVSFALNLSQNGELLGIIPLFQSESRGKKVIEVDRRMIVPERVIRASNISANFLCDNSAYVLGISTYDKEKPGYALKRFQEFREFNLNLLKDLDCPEAGAVVAFITSYNPAQAKNYAVISQKYDDIVNGNNLVFRLDAGNYVHDIPEVKRAWERYKSAAASDITGQCLVTGETGPIARLHPGIKGVKGGQPSGVSLVGFNARAYESFNRIEAQGLNAPTSEKAAFEYSAALNYLLSHEIDNPKFYIGDTTVVYWAESANNAYSEIFSTLFDPDWASSEEFSQRRDQAANQRLRDIAQKIKRGDPLDPSGIMEDLDQDTNFYILGLAPNAARASVRFFHRDPFKKIINNILRHYEDLKIVRDFDTQPARIPIRYILEETVSKKAKEKKSSPILAGALMRAILNGTPYPAGLLNAIINRIRADQDDTDRRIYKINYVRAAVIKAYLARRYRFLNQNQYLEVLNMSLNQQSTNQAYLLGRLFAVLEKAQIEAAAPTKLNATIKDRYFTTACASPATVFPVLLRLAQHHFAKAEYGKLNDKRVEEIVNCLEMENHPIPTHLSLEQQGIFVLGYYHQRAAFYPPKEN
jgi:CRISPR-associated protein Csd1